MGTVLRRDNGCMVMVIIMDKVTEMKLIVKMWELATYYVKANKLDKTARLLVVIQDLTKNFTVIDDETHTLVQKE